MVPEMHQLLSDEAVTHGCILNYSSFSSFKIKFCFLISCIDFARKYMLNRIQNVKDKTFNKQFCMFMPNFNMNLSNMNTNMISMTRTRFLKYLAPFHWRAPITYIWLLLWFTDWISDVIVSRSNSSYLKVTFDVKSRNVKWYAVELWDSLNNLIKSERTGKVYIGDISQITQRRFLLFKLSGQLFHVDWFCARYEK